MKINETKSALTRLKKYINRRKNSRGLDENVIHTFDPSTENEISLMMSDIEILLSAVDELISEEK